MRWAVVALMVGMIGSAAMGQMSPEEAMKRLEEREAKRQAIEAAATTRPSTQPTEITHAHRHIVFVVQADGGILNVFSDARRQILLAVSHMATNQMFDVVFCQDSNRDGYVPFRRDLTQANEASTAMLQDFQGTVIPRGACKLVPGIQFALRRHPDTVWIVTDGNIRDSREVEASIASFKGEVNVALFNDTEVTPEQMKRLLGIARRHGGVCVNAKGTPIKKRQIARREKHEPEKSVDRGPDTRPSIFDFGR